MTTPITADFGDHGPQTVDSMHNHVMGIGHLSENRAVTIELHATAGGDGYLTAGLYLVLTVGGYSRTITRDQLRTFGNVRLSSISSIGLAALVPPGSGWTVNIIPL